MGLILSFKTILAPQKREHAKERWRDSERARERERERERE
jgi:hypothetical protein